MAGEGADGGESLGSLLARARNLYEKIENFEIAKPEERAEASVECQSCLEKLQSAISARGIFSGNEYLEEISTGDIYLLSVDYYLGSLLLKTGLSSAWDRLQVLERAEHLLKQHVDKCCDLGVLVGAEKREWESEWRDELPIKSSKVSPEEARARKIARFKLLKETKAQIESLSAHMEDDDPNLSALGADESLQRDLAIATLQLLARQAIDEIRGIVTEKDMVRMMAERESRGEREDPRMDRAENIPRVSRGLEVTHVTKDSAGRFEVKKEVVRGTIFRPTVAPPTMSVEEWGEIELQRAMEREEKEKNAPKPDRRYEQLEKDGDEDVADFVDKATIKDRAWDDWKDEHPRGMGNKANKRF